MSRQDKEVSSAFRARGATLWKTETPGPCNLTKFLSKVQHQKQNPVDVVDADEMDPALLADLDAVCDTIDELRILTDADESSLVQHHKPRCDHETPYIVETVQNFKALCVAVLVPASVLPSLVWKAKASTVHEVYTTLRNKDVCAERIKAAVEARDAACMLQSLQSASTVPRCVSTLSASSDEHPVPSNDQMIGLEYLNAHIVNADVGHVQCFALVLGPPGTGKTWFLNQFRLRMSNANKVVLSSAFTGIAASQIPGADTVHTTYSFPVREKGHTPMMSLPELHTSQRVSMEYIYTADCIITDEISNITPEMLGNISLRIQEVCGGVGALMLPFAGKHCVLSGDFLQLPSIGGTGSLYDALLRSVGLCGSHGQLNRYMQDPSSPYSVGVGIFSQVRLVMLNEQVCRLHQFCM
jgi:hypothetical protein